jgi:D-tyrosyl-tRNA(Tyr) deacylase
MKCVVQRVSRAQVVVEREVVGSIRRGMLVLLCVMRGDGANEARALAEKLAQFRFFPDEAGKMNRSALDLGLEVLVVSQFTLAADGRAGRRPSFDAAAEPELARILCEAFVASLRGLGLRVETGRFGAHMEVELVNDGPVTFALETPSN